MPINAELIWIRTKQGGNTFLMTDGNVVFGVKAGDADDDPDGKFVEAHESHFATCPQAGKFRQPRKPREREQWKPIF